MITFAAMTSSPLPPPPSQPSGDVELLDRLAAARTDLLGQVGQRIVGQKDVLDGILTAIFSGGHALLVGVPGLALPLPNLDALCLANPALLIPPPCPAPKLTEEVRLDFLTGGRVEKEEVDPAVLVLHLRSLEGEGEGASVWSV